VRGFDAGGSAAARWPSRPVNGSRSPALPWGVHQRDKHAAGTLLGRALALRLFLFFVPAVLLVFGIAGILGWYSTVDSLQEFGIGGAFGDSVVITVLQVVTQLYLRQKISGASSMYGTFGAVAAFSAGSSSSGVYWHSRSR
jgi:hypothetical protein